MITEENVRAAWKARCTARRPNHEQAVAREEGENPVCDHLERLGIDVEAIGKAFSSVLPHYQGEQMSPMSWWLAFYLEGVEIGVRAARREERGGLRDLP